MGNLHILGQDGKVPPPEDDEDDGKVPTVVTHALKVIHPMFTDQATGQPLPPPPDHEFRVGMQLSITGKGRVVQEAPGIFFASGDDIEEVVEVLADVIKQGLNHVKAASSPIKVANEGMLHALDKTLGKEV